MHSIHELLEVALERSASDLMLAVGIAPVLRVDGRIQKLDSPILTPQLIHEFALEILFSAGRDRMLQGIQGLAGPVEPEAVENRVQDLIRKQALCVVFTIARTVRVRAQLFLNRGAVSAMLRLLPFRPASVEELGLPPALSDVIQNRRGLVVITGPAGMGKTTTVAALVEEINRNRQANIILLEDLEYPVETPFTNCLSVIQQVEWGGNAATLSSTLANVSRQCPDVVVIGELRDPETAEAALDLAAEGCLVLATLQCDSTASALDRIIAGFPAARTGHLCRKLAASLLCVTSQVLVPRLSGTGRAPAVEVLLSSPSLEERLREGKPEELLATLHAATDLNLFTLDQALERLFRARIISLDEAMNWSRTPADLSKFLFGHPLPVKAPASVSPPCTAPPTPPDN